VQAENEQQQPEQEQGLPFEPNSLIGTLIVATALCLICSFVVSTTAVALRPLQEANRANKMKRNVLIAVGIWDADVHTDADIDDLFESIETILVNLPDPDPDAPEAGTLNVELDPATYNQRSAAKNPEESVSVPRDLDVAGIKRREKVSLAYLVRDEAGEVKTIVLPVYGKGLWSTLYGYLALDRDARTVRGITFYEHGETPGLGGEVDNPRWKAQWPGKTVADEEGNPVLVVTKPDRAEEEHEVDGLSGATVTAVGVQNTVRYWLGEHAFGPFLDQFRAGELALNR
jgi:Na+-transporting NADH:ubiquinone oxidoreductase subunit C